MNILSFFDGLRADRRRMDWLISVGAVTQHDGTCCTVSVPWARRAWCGKTLRDAVDAAMREWAAGEGRDRTDSQAASRKQPN